MGALETGVGLGGVVGAMPGGACVSVLREELVVLCLGLPPVGCALGRGWGPGPGPGPGPGQSIAPVSPRRGRRYAAWLAC